MSPIAKKSQKSGPLARLWEKVAKSASRFGFRRAAMRGMRFAYRKLFRKDCPQEQALTVLNSWLKEHTLAQPWTPPEEIYRHKIDIVVPVYNGYEYLQPLLAAIPQTRMDYRLLLIDDHSTDPRVLPYLRQQAAQDARITVVPHETNLGFVRTVNHGFQQTGHHIALLNTDIDLPPLWLERLMAPILMSSRTASSTPFANTGIFCGFPKPRTDNTLLDTLRRMDAPFQTIRPAYTKLPTGVGFCMGMNRDVLKEIGLFDAETFGRGYGEEFDWCLRAVKAGYVNVAVENLFVYHKAGGSFQSDERELLIKRSIRKLNDRYHHFTDQTNAFYDADPLRPFREYAHIRAIEDAIHPDGLLAYAGENPPASGLEAHLQAHLEGGGKCVIVRNHSNRQEYTLTYRYGSAQYSFLLSGLTAFTEMCRLIQIDSLLVHETEATQEAVSTLKVATGATVRFLG